MASTSTVRRARKAHWCETCDRRAIKPGDLHLVGTVFPGEEFAGDTKHPVRLRECRACAERYGRGDRFTP